MQDHQIPRRRVPLLAGEHVGQVVGSLDTPMLNAATGLETAVWLEAATVELQRAQLLESGEHLVEVAADLSFARTSLGRLVPL
jgi:hypothetical protein